MTPWKAKVVKVNDDSTYADITEAVVENEKQKSNQLKKINLKKSANLKR
jgi:hypothetical protein